MLDLSGVPVYYYRCPSSEFIFTTAFDRFTNDELRQHIHNKGHLLGDPDYRHRRPRACANLLCRLFAGPGRSAGSIAAATAS